MNTKALRQKVLDLAIHGKLVPQNPNDESATVLLEKIRAEKAEKIKKGELKADKKDSFIFVGSDKRHYEQFADGSVKDIEDEIPFEVPEGWTWCRLGNIGKWQSGTTPNKKNLDYYKNGTIPWLLTGDLNDGLVTEIPNCITEKALKETSLKINPIGSVCIAMYGATIGKLGILNTPATTNQACCVCYEFYGINNKYLFYFLKEHKEEFIQQGFGGAQPNISKEKIVDTFIPLPPLSEQECIVKSIETYFEQIDSLEENKYDLQTAIKQAKSKILDLAIHGKLVPQNPNDEPAEELLKRIATSDNRPYEKVESSEIDWTLPNNWCLCHFGDIATVINGKNQSKVENPNGKYPIYGSGGIMGRADDYICPENCTIIGRKGSINNPIFVEEKFWNVDTAFGLCPSEAILPKFLFYFCEYFDFTTLDSSTTLPSLTKTNIQQIIFALPPIEEQKRILDKTVELFGKLDEIVLNLV